jgi:hypothetical protein
MSNKNIKYCKLIPNCISPFLCEEIIEKFEQMPNKYVGHTGNGRIEHIKKTIDYNIPFTHDGAKNKKYDEEDYFLWKDISDALKKTLGFQIKKYIKDINDIMNENNTSSVQYNCFNDVFFDTLLMHKYYKNIGKFEYHTDDSVEKELHRVFTYIFYLNDVEHGGETEVINYGNVKPKTGSLFLFPATWTAPHKGHTPISNDKYIITGWVFKRNK